MRARGPRPGEEAELLLVSSATAKRAYFASRSEPNWARSNWRQRQLLGEGNATTSAGPEIVRVRCESQIHRLRLFTNGGPAVLLDHPRVDRKAELALIALGAPFAQRPDCLLILDAIAGRVSARRILGRRRAYPIARRGVVRRRCRRPGPISALERPLVERYAEFVRHRAALWLDSLLPSDMDFEVLIIPPPSLRVEREIGSLWSSRERPGTRLTWWGLTMEVHIPFDWHVSVERAHGTRLRAGFILDVRADRRGRMLQRLVVTRSDAYRYARKRRIEAIDSGEPVPSHRWLRARRQCLIVLPDIRPNLSTGADSQ